MFALKQPRKKRYLSIEEDNDFVRLNLVYDESACTTFTSEEEARKVRDDTIENAKQQLAELNIQTNLDILEKESLMDFIDFTIVQIKV